MITIWMDCYIIMKMKVYSMCYFTGKIKLKCESIRKPIHETRLLPRPSANTCTSWNAMSAAMR